MATILITGGSGLVGQNLTNKLIKKGHNVRVLSRVKKSNKPNLSYFEWNVNKGILDIDALTGIDALIHLAGAGVADKAWTKNYKSTILESRVSSLQLIYDKCKSLNSFPKTIISASGTAIYGFENGSTVFSESESNGKGFLADVCQEWESASLCFEQENVRRVVFRIGVVLSKNGGALKPLKSVFSVGLGSSLGTGSQPFAWIHIDDLGSLIETAFEKNNYTGIYNAVSPQCITNNEFSKTLAKEMGVLYWVPNVPAFVLRIILGKERANEVLLNGAFVSAKKVQKNGFNFSFPKLSTALKDLL